MTIAWTSLIIGDEAGWVAAVAGTKRLCHCPCMAEFKQLIGRLKALLRHRGCSREDAEDLIQDAFVRLQSYCREVRNEEAFLVRSVHNAHIDAYRRGLRQSEVREMLADPSFWAPAIAPEEQAELDQRLQDVRVMLDEWPLRTRDIYLLHHLGYGYGEIAKMNGISESAVEKHMAKAAYLLAQWRAGR